MGVSLAMRQLLKLLISAAGDCAHAQSRPRGTITIVVPVFRRRPTTTIGRNRAEGCTSRLGKTGDC